MFVHGDNLSQKETHETKYNDEVSQAFLREIREHYDIWKKANLELKGPVKTPQASDHDVIQQRVALLAGYKDFIDQQKFAERFDSRSNLHSTVLEEFCLYLLNDLVADLSANAHVGKAATFKDLFFQPPNFPEMTRAPHAKIETKDHDFVIGSVVSGVLSITGGGVSERHEFSIPAVAIECKTYLDKTMLEGASGAGLQLKAKNPNAIYLIVSEWLKLTEEVNLSKYAVDQVFVLRKQRNTDRELRFSADYVKNPIDSDIVELLFRKVRGHLTSDWSGGIDQGLRRGYLIEDRIPTV